MPPLKLKPPDTHHLSAAIGWLELGAPEDALEELDRISSPMQKHPDILELRWAICAQREDWQACLTIARGIRKEDSARPSGWVHQAYALRRGADEGLEAAWNALLPAADLFPKNATVPYNLSCYACQMKKLDLARTWLMRAFKIGKKEEIKQMALEDPDLEPLWAEIRKM